MSDERPETLAMARQANNLLRLNLDRVAAKRDRMTDRLCALEARWREYAAVAESKSRAEHWTRCADCLRAVIEDVDESSAGWAGRGR